MWSITAGRWHEIHFPLANPDEMHDVLVLLCHQGSSCFTGADLNLNPWGWLSWLSTLSTTLFPKPFWLLCFLFFVKFYFAVFTALRHCKPTQVFVCIISAKHIECTYNEMSYINKIAIAVSPLFALIPSPRFLLKRWLIIHGVCVPLKATTKI